MQEGVGEDLETAIRRVLLLYGMVFSVGGIPLIYLGDEVGVLNRYEYETEPAQASDSRWVHRPAWSEELYGQRHEMATVPGRIFSGLVHLSAQRRSHPVFGVQALTVMDTGQRSVLAFHKQGSGQLLTVIANFSDQPATIDTDMAGRLLAGRQGKDLLSHRLVLPGEVIHLEPCELLWVLLPAD
jgi:glycosidase